MKNKSCSRRAQFVAIHFSWILFFSFLLISLPGHSQRAVVKTLPTDESPMRKPAWISEIPLAFIGTWDVKPLFRTRVGGTPVWQAEEYKKTSQEATIKKFKDMGVTMLLIPFYKGFGLQAEKQEMDDSKKVAVLCRKYGIKVGVYIGATMAYESFLLEEPEAKEWIVPNFMGKPVIYGNQSFRKLVYFQHPGYKAYIKRVLRLAVENLKADLIHFDNVSVQAQPPVFYHPLAIENFRTFLRKKYSPDMLMKRFGFRDVKYVEPPLISPLVSVVNDPMFQEFTDFRCQQLADYYGEMEKYIRGLNPQVAVEINPHGLNGVNKAWEEGIDYPRILAHTDFFWIEDQPTSLADGVLTTQIRTFKMAETLNNRVFTYTSDSKVAMAESMAYNRQGMGMVGGREEMEGSRLAHQYELQPGQQDYINFFHKNFNLYSNVHSVADIAILHSYATMAYNSDRPYQSTFLFEQALIQAKIPFDIIFDDQLKNLSKYKVLILADQECLNDDKLDLVKSFVKNGGGLVATEHTSLYTEWHERKRDFGLKDLFNVSAPEWHNRSSPEDILDIPVQRNQYGRGRVCYIPEVRAAKKKPATMPMTGQYWKLPLNWSELVESVKSVSNEKFGVDITEAPLTVTMQLAEKNDHSALVLHLINFAPVSSAIENIKVSLKIPSGKSVKGITLMSPDGVGETRLKYTENATGQVMFSVPQLLTYGVILAELK
ncbi:MAG: hypothetical protein JWP94_18 [Mucilaginibacter sp.]|nr:hypothetical protein [Mucilaginibacter sp.]